MLVALCQGHRVEADVAPRAAEYRCPGCDAKVILRRGRQVCAHFAHVASRTCTGSRGETRDHLAMKALITRGLRDRNVRVEAEYCLGDTPWERRADVMCWTPNSNTPIAIEVQRSSLPVKELEHRALSYARLRVAQFWISFLPRDALQQADRRGAMAWQIARYAPRQHEFWIHGLNGQRGSWMVDPETQKFWKAHLAPYELRTKEALWYEMGAVKRYRRPGTRPSKRYRTLHLHGPFDLADLKIKLFETKPWQSRWFRWPGGICATFVHA